ncbi:hypothetical protein DENSPDRAFT_854889 [Dentipellis sp. KUC8613]|nr:hypothetical protein DENSPDRAFT_854889 [Dentipellis sp. KUC8613]
MALSLPIPSSPSSGNSPSSADSPNPPQTPVSPTNSVQTLSLPPPAEQATAQTGTTVINSSAQSKRKPSRRANTAERRATHNAVERQRRETLNGRFLDLAALLPNLSQIRRPSKSAIVNSSIAHIHASRRHRLMASRELRLLKLEADALRRELNEWRDRASLPRVEEPVRSEAFSMVLSGEVEVLAIVPGMDDEDEDGAGDGYDNDDSLHGVNGGQMAEDVDDLRGPMVPAYAKGASFGQAHPGGLAHILPRPAAHGGPMIAQSIPNVSYENPAMASLYDHPQLSTAQFQGRFPMTGMNLPLEAEKPSWNNQLLASQQLQQQFNGQGPIFNPAHGVPNGGNAFGNNGAYYSGMSRQQHGMQGAHGYVSPIDSDDASSVGSSHNSLAGGLRSRGGSLSTGSTYGSPPHVRAPSSSSNPGNYDMLASGSNADFGVPKRLNAGGWAREEMEGMGPMKPNMATSPISVGGGGNGTGFAMMM